MMRRSANEIMHNAWNAKVVIPSFNIPYLPMMEPVTRAIRDTKCFALIAVARIEWVRFQAKGPKAVYELYQTLKDERYMRLHLDHVPAFEDGQAVNYEPIMAEAIELGYDSVMIDGSYLPLPQNVAATRKVVEMARKSGVAVEGEIGLVMGYDPKDMPPYEELFASGKGFTDPGEAAEFTNQSQADWVSVALGNIHGAMIGATKSQKKLQARLSIERLDEIAARVKRPIVLHGGTGIKKESLQEAIRHGVAKLNVGMAIRQPYEKSMNDSVQAAQEQVYEATVRQITEELEIVGSASIVNPQD